MVKKTAKEIHCRLVGLTPLLIYRFIHDYKPEKVIEDPRAECEKRLHTAGPELMGWDEATSDLKEGTVIIPQDAIFQSFMNGGKFEKLGKRQVTTEKASLMPGYAALPGFAYKLEYDRWEADVRPVSNALGQRMLCYRPRFDNWSFELTIKLHEPGEFSPALMRKCVDHAGTKIGLLSYRPQKKGSYGIFRVDEWKEI